MPRNSSAPDTRLGRNVALKVLPPHIATDPTALARFEREAQVVASLSHPNIVSLYEFGRHDSIVFAAIELLFVETQPRITSDGRWIAFTSTESGHNEVYVQPFPSGGKTRVSIGGGSNPRWRHDGRELYYVARDASLMEIDVDLSHPPPTFGEPHVLFNTNHLSRSYAGSDYVPAADGQRFLLTMPAESSSPPSIIVTTNWLNLLNR